MTRQELCNAILTIVRLNGEITMTALSDSLQNVKYSHLRLRCQELEEEKRIRLIWRTHVDSARLIMTVKWLG